MTTRQHNAATQNWLSRQSPAVRAAWQEYPHNHSLMIEGKEHWVIGYGEVNQVATLFNRAKTAGVYLILSSIDPQVDYEAAISDGPHKVRYGL